MLYVKNIPGWERATRIVVGAGALGATPMGWALGGMGVMAAMSGLLGFCPACAMVGRKLDGQQG